MSSPNESLPITPQAFAAALEDLPVSALHLKVLEIYNSIAHLKYSNEQLRPFAEGIEAPLGSSTGESAQNQPDPDCVEAILENEQVIARMEERVQLIKNEVERRGLSWTEFERKDEVEAAAARNRARGPVETGEDSDDEEQGQPMTNGTSTTTTTTTQHPAWMDGTFQTGVIRNGEIVMDDVAGSRRQQEQQGGTGVGAGGSLSDEELRRRMEERLRDLGGENDEEDGGMHL
ncbi:hypothetical protein B0T13DRAFT_511388 [Neurospora crassa]|nr:hypothetical protein B0T13DRAFT_511388 [Neurospora crassa]